MFNIRTHLVTLLCVLVCVIFMVLTEAENPSTQGSQIDKLTDYYRNKCYVNSKNAKNFDTLYMHAAEFEKYLKYAFTFIPDKKKTFCESIRGQLESRVEQLSADLKPCLSNEERYFPNFIQDSFKGFTHFLCHNRGENIDSFFSTQGMACREAIEADTSNEIGNCFGKIFKPLSGYISKNELCDDIAVSEKCFTLVLDKKCPNFRAFQELNSKFYKNIRKPCSLGCVSYINSLLLTFCLLFALIINH